MFIEPTWRALAVDDQQLGVQLEVLLAADLDAEALEQAQRGERVEDVPLADAVLAAAQEVAP